MEKLKKQFRNKFKLSNNDNNTFILPLRKGVYPNECMNEWEMVNETILPEKDSFHGNWNMEDITDSDYKQAKRIFKDLEVKSLVEYYNLYLYKTIH